MSYIRYFLILSLSMLMLPSLAKNFYCHNNPIISQGIKHLTVFCDDPEIIQNLVLPKSLKDIEFLSLDSKETLDLINYEHIRSLEISDTDTNISFDNYKFSDNLKELNIRGDFGINETTLLPNNLKKLVIFDEDLTDVQLSSLKLPEALEYLSIGYSYKLTEEALDYIRSLSVHKIFVQASEFVPRFRKIGLKTRVKDYDSQSVTDFIAKSKDLKYIRHYKSPINGNKLKSKLTLDPNFVVPDGIKTLELNAIVSGNINGFDVNDLKTLYLSGRSINNIINFNLRDLKWLDLSNMDFKDFDFNNIDFRNSSLETLDISNSGLDNTNLKTINFPDSLENLYLWDNEVTSLSEVVFPTELTLLIASNNKISNLSDSSLPDALSYLSFSNNQITEFKDFVLPAKLQKLILSGNKLERMSNLTFPTDTELAIYLDNNRLDNKVLDALPENIILLSLRNNRLEANIDLSRFPNLQYLDLSENNIQSITGLSGMNDLVKLTATGTKIIKSELNLPGHKVKVIISKKDARSDFEKNR